MAELNEAEVLHLVETRMANGENPLDIVKDCREGMERVGELYEKREYYLSGLIMGGEIFQEVMRRIGPIMNEQNQGNELGSVMLGTVAGDIHNIGKNILSMLLTSNGFTVYDLGVDVAATTFLEQAKELKPDAIGLSGLLTSSFDAMKETIHLFRAEGNNPVGRIPIVVGGAMLDAEVSSYVGAEYWANDAVVGVRLFKELLETK